MGERRRPEELLGAGTKAFYEAKPGLRGRYAVAWSRKRYRPHALWQLREHLVTQCLTVFFYAYSTYASRHWRGRETRSCSEHRRRGRRFKLATRGLEARKHPPLREAR